MAISPKFLKLTEEERVEVLSREQSIDAHLYEVIAQKMNRQVVIRQLTGVVSQSDSNRTHLVEIDPLSSDEAYEELASRYTESGWKTAFLKFTNINNTKVLFILGE